MVKAHHDYETSSTCDLRLCGAYRYAEDPETRVWCMSWRISDGPVQRWHPGDADPHELLNHVREGGMLCSHNSTFERCIWNITLRSQPQYAHWPALRIEQQDDTMARGLAIHLPADLETLAQVLGLPDQKDREGAALMKKMAKPRKIFSSEVAATMTRSNTPEWTSRPDGTLIQWWNTPENLARLGVYCDKDVLAECGVDERLPPLSADERALWELDQRINDRGIALDIPTIERAVEIRKVALEHADAEMRELTDGAVNKCTETGKIVGWLRDRGIECDSVAKSEHEEIKLYGSCLGDDKVAKVLNLRAESNKTSTAKFEKMLKMVCADGRVRGLHMYHRAGTGRFGGAGVQGQNLPRVEEVDLPHVLAAIEVLEMFT